MAVRVEDVVAAHDESESIAPEPSVDHDATSPSLPTVVDAECAEFSEGLDGRAPRLNEVLCAKLGEPRFRATSDNEIAHGRSARRTVQYHTIRQICLIISG